MNAMLSSMRRHYITRLGLSLLIVALIAGLTGCVGEASRTVKYDLTIASGAGGSVTVPGQGTFSCDSGRVVDLTAIPTSGYRFAKWTGAVSTIANPNAASTTITMSGNYSIRATFEQAEATFYTLTVGVAGSGSTTPTAGQHTYGAGAVVSISATPSGGYHFVNWTGNVGSVANVNAASTTITMNGNYSITANFEQTVVTYYTLTMAVTGNGSTSPPLGQHAYAAATPVPIVATPAGGYQFVNWTAPAGSFTNASSAVTTFTMPAQNVTVTAHFVVAVPYTLTMGITGSGSTSPAVGPHTYTGGTPVPISVSPAAGYYFSHWTATAGSFTNASSATTSFIMPAQNVTVTANLVEGPPFPPGQYTLTMAVAGSGSTSPAVGPHTYSAGTPVPIIATPAGGYQFVNWTAPAGSFANANSATTTFTMPAQNVTVTAHFAPTQTYTLTMAVNPGVGGTTTPTGTSPYTAGTVVNIQAVAAAGYRFVNWTAPAGSFANPNSAATTFTMPTQNVTVTANFVPVYSLTMAVAPGGSGTATDLTGASPYTAGTVVNIQAVATAGYTFTNWTAPAGTLGSATAATTTFTMPAQAVTVTAHFQLAPTYALTMAVTPPSSGTATDQTGAGSYQQGTQVSIRAQAAGGYYFVNWTASAGSFANPSSATTTFTMPAQAITVTAHFEGINFMVSAGERHTVGVKSDGTVVAVGDNGHGQCNVGGWTNIVQVAAGDYRTVGLKSDGTVVAVGANDYGECNVGGWTNVVQVSTGSYHTVGLRSNGTVAAVGDNGIGQCNVGSWTNIVQVAAGLYHTVGVKSDGTVVAVGYNDQGQCNVGNWTNIVQVAAGLYHTVGVKSDGTVTAVGWNQYGQCNVSGWMDIIHVAAGWYHTVGTRSDGTVVAVGANWWEMCNVSSWADIARVGAGAYHTVAVKSDGTVVSVGANLWGQCYVGGWDLN